MKRHYLYRTTCPCGYVYVGKHSSESPETDPYYGSGVRLREHAKEMGGRRHFSVEILAFFESESEAYEEEARIVDEEFLNSVGCLNLVLGGYGAAEGERNHFFGKTHTLEARRRLAEAQRGRTHTETTRQRLKESHTGMTHSEATRQKLRAITISRDVGGDKNPMFGKRHDEEVKRRISDSVTGINNHNYGKPLTENTRLKLKIANGGVNHPMFGKTLPHHTRRRISEVQMAKPAWERGRTSPRARKVWSLADEAYSLWTSGSSVPQICRSLGFAVDSSEYDRLRCVLVPMFRDGWSPTEDARWLSSFKGCNS